MRYEFTRRKIAADRKALVKRLAIAGVAGCIGFGTGSLTNDLASPLGLFCAAILAIVAAFAASVWTGLLNARL